MSRNPLRLVLALTLVGVAACGGDAATTTTADPGTTVAQVTTTTTEADTTTTKPGDNRVQSLRVAGGFEGGGTPTEVPDAPAGGGYDEYLPITDDSGILVVNVPAAWSDVDGSVWVDNPFGLDGGPGGIGVQVTGHHEVMVPLRAWGILEAIAP